MTRDLRSKISIVMPCYNSEAFVREATDSVLQQTYRNTELIFLDDGSQDNSVALVQSLAQAHNERIRLLRCEHRGPYPTRNTGLREVTGDFIAFLDADDYWDRECLKKLLFVIKDKNADLAYCGWQNVGEFAPSGLPYVPPSYENRDLFSDFLKGCPWPIHAALVRKTVVDDVGGFSERYFTSMDYDFWLRIAAKTQKFVRVPEVLSLYRWHDRGQISSSKWRQTRDSWRVRRDFIKQHRSLVAHLSHENLRDNTDGFLLRSAYNAYWNRDLVSAQHLFRRAMVRFYWKPRDIKYILPSMLPGFIYRYAIRRMDHQGG